MRRTGNAAAAVRGLGIAALGAALLVPIAPAQASEVVKLARLVITGKRQPSRPPAAPQPAPTDRVGDGTTQPQSRAGDNEPHVYAQQRRTGDVAVTMTE
ncbi:hypothetical protein [Roseateles chitosanitabidus]|uniref:hypothetical protein n=1 Tax=Roseateles chitosanitabidus TaxID=65048 RepID=UPI00082E88C9|nr:hypothetical protein [Roseateles chitosanitabidus]MBO9689450.1 hypothetical protein [Roseateles chitosanitabidus]